MVCMPSRHLRTLAMCEQLSGGMALSTSVANQSAKPARWSSWRHRHLPLLATASSRTRTPKRTQVWTPSTSTEVGAGYRPSPEASALRLLDAMPPAVIRPVPAKTIVKYGNSQQTIGSSTSFYAAPLVTVGIGIGIFLALVLLLWLPRKRLKKAFKVLASSND